MGMVYSDYSIGCAACPDDESIWIASDLTGVVMQFSLSSFELQKKYFINELTNDELFSRAIRSGNNIFFIPNNASAVWSVNTVTGEVSRINIGLTSDEVTTGEKFKSAHIWGDKLVLFGCNVPGVIIVYLNDYTYKRLYRDEQGLDGERCVYFYHVLASEGRFCYLPLKGCNDIVRFDCEDESLQLVYCNEDYDERYNFAYIYEGTLALSASKDRIIEIDLNCFRSNIKQMELIPKENEGFYRRIIRESNRMVLLPSSIGLVFYSDDHGSFESIPVDNKTYKGWTEYARFEFDFVYDNKLYFQSRVDGEVYIFDLSNMELRSSFFAMSECDLDGIANCRLRHLDNIFINEEHDLSVKHFTNYLCQEK